MPLGIEAKTRDVVLRVLWSDRLQDPDRYHVLRLGERHAHADGPFVSAVVVFRFPYLPTGEGRVDHHRSVVDDGLEARTRLAPGLGDVVVLASIEVETADQGANGAILRVGGDKGALGLRKLDDLPVVGFVFLDADHGSGPDSPRRYALTRLGVASSTSAARMSSLSG